MANLPKSHPGEHNAVGPPIGLRARFPAKKSLWCVMPFSTSLAIKRTRYCLHEMHSILEPGENDVPVGAQLNGRWSHSAMDNAKIMKSDQSTSLARRVSKV